MSLHGDWDLSRILRAGHDEYFEFACDSCSIENCHVQAVGHCKNCAQNICNDCIKIHKKLAGLMSHVLENKPKVISSKDGQKDTEIIDPLIDYCSTHPDELIRFHCSVHSTLACDDCLALNHRYCNDVVHIRDISGNIANSEELNTLQSGLRRLEETLAKYKTDTERIQTDFTERYASIVKEIKQWRTDIDKILNKIEEKLLEEASTISMDYISCLKNNSSSCDDLITETKKLLSDLDDQMKAGQFNSLYVSVIHNQETMDRLKQMAALIGEQCKSRHLSFQRHENIVTMLSDEGLGNVFLSDPAKIQAKHERDVNVKSSTDMQDCSISGVIVLPDESLCICDNNNISIKIVDTKRNLITEQLTLSAEPIDATMNSLDEVAILTLESKVLQILSISPTLHQSRTIRLRNDYSSITYCDGKLLLIHASDDGYGLIDIYDITGHRIKVIETNVDGTKIFTDPYKLCVSPDHSMMYVTDNERHAVVCMNMDGDVINVYRNEQLRAPWGITVDQDGNVYVCSYDNHMIHQLTPTGQLVQILLDQKDGLRYPRSIAYKSGQLYISSLMEDPEYSNNIDVFRLALK